MSRTLTAASAASTARRFGRALTAVVTIAGLTLTMAPVAASASARPPGPAMQAPSNSATASPPALAAQPAPTGRGDRADVAGALAADQTTVSSPDHDTEVAVAAVDGRLSYTVIRHGETIVAPSGLGLDLADKPSLTEDMSIESTERQEIDETWEPRWGTDSRVRNHANELTVHGVQADTGARLDVIVRVFDDGVGLRYHFPEQPGFDHYTVTAEQTEFALEPGSTSWSLAAGNDWRADEKHYREMPLSEVPTAQTPITLRTPGNQFVVLHEADLTDYPSMTMKAVAGEPGTFRSELISLPDGTKAVLAGEFSTPWRTLTIGDRAGDLAESHLIENLNDPCAICDGDTNWIAPATYVGVWWELQRRATTWTAGPKHGATTERVEQYIDLAAEAGAKFVLAEGWNTNAGGSWTNQDFTTPRDDFDLEGVLAYAREKGVGFIAHNETRGYVDYYDANLERIFSRYEELGIHAIKTGYATRFELGGVNRSTFDQEAVRHFQRVIDAAARHHITIDAHEAIKPTGLARTYPNMMTGEGVAGMEQQNYMGAGGNPPAQATILPFTRFMGGPADYTPGVLNVTWDPANLGTRVQTTSTAQLSLYTTFFSPMQMLADTPENYAASDGFEYLKGMPATWDESHVVDSEIGDYVTTARRSGQTWYLGSITDENDRTLQTPLDFLGSGKFVAEIYADSQDTTWKGNPLPIESSTVLVRRSTTISASMVGGGGYAMKIRPATAAEARSLPDYRSPRAALGAVSAQVVTTDGDAETEGGATQTLEVSVPLANTGSTVGAFDVEVSIDGRTIPGARQVRIGTGNQETVDLWIAADQLPDRDFRLRVGVGADRTAAVTVTQPRSLAGEIAGLRDAGEITARVANRLRAAVIRSDATLRRGDVIGRLQELQRTRLAMYAYGTEQVSSAAREHLDELLSFRLGSPEGLIELARRTAEFRDQGDASETLTQNLIDRIEAAAEAAGTGDTAGLARGLNGLAQVVATAPADALSDEAAEELQRRIAALLAPARTVEAETIGRLGAACFRTDHVDYTGTGFIACLKTVGSGVRLDDAVTAPGSYDLVIRYANSMGSTRTMTVSTPASTQTVEFANLPNWDRWSERTVTLRVGAGEPISIRYGDADNGNINIDSVTVRPRLGVIVVPAG